MIRGYFTIFCIIATFGLLFNSVQAGSPCVEGAFFNPSSCNSSSAGCTDALINANASGNVQSPPVVLDHIDSPINFNWAYTVASYPPDVAREDFNPEYDLESGLWVAPSSNIDLYSGTNPFSACGIFITGPVDANYSNGLTLNSMELGQTDDGTCSSFLPNSCREVLIRRAVEIATYSVGDGGGVNMTTAEERTVLPSVCENIAAALDITYETSLEACTPYFSVGDLQIVGKPLTSTPDTAPSCHGIQSGLNYQYFSSVVVGYLSTDMAWNIRRFNNIHWKVNTVMTVIMPAANSSQLPRIPENQTQAWIQCVRITNYSAGSMEAQPLVAGIPLPTTATESPAASSTTSSAAAETSTTDAVDNGRPTGGTVTTGVPSGAIGGATVGAVAVVALLGGVSFYLYRRRRRQYPTADFHWWSVFFTEAPDTQRHEVLGDCAEGELEGVRLKIEMPVREHELARTRPASTVQEMPANSDR